MVDCSCSYVRLYVYVLHAYMYQYACIYLSVNRCMLYTQMALGSSMLLSCLLGLRFTQEGIFVISW